MDPQTSIIDTGNTAFMLLCASLVMLMTPGLAFFYGGLVGRRNVLTIMFQSFLSLGWTTVLWFAFGYSMCFGPSLGASSAIPRITPFCTASRSPPFSRWADPPRAFRSWCTSPTR